MIRIACLPPYQELADLMTDASNELGIETVIEIVSDLDSYMKTARKMADSGIKVIVSRGVAAWKIKFSQMGIAVVDIPVTGIDLMRTLDQAMQFDPPFGICEIEPVIRTAISLEEYTGIKLIKKEIDHYGMIEPGIKWLQKQGVRTVFGRLIAANLAENYGMQPVTIESSKQAVIVALSEAQRLCVALETEQARAEEFRTILDFAYEGILAVDAAGKITFFNPVAERILGQKKEDIIGQKAVDVIPNTRLADVMRSKKPALEQIQDINETKIITSRIPILVDGNIKGAVATFQEVGHLQNMEQTVRRKLNPRGHIARYTFARALGKSDVFRSCIAKARRFARVDTSILILGETGTGKEIFAQAIHNESRRADLPFVAVNCASLPENLLESELFGYASGAFTGALKEGKPGLFELAHGGTIFLDEIPEMSPRLQAELLRVLEQREVARIGDDKVIPIDVRVIASSNEDPALMIKEEKFRPDLYYRLNVLRIELPPLRERRQDIALLATSFLSELSQRHNGMRSSFNSSALSYLTSLDWPGNVRELRNIIERVAVISEQRTISREALEEIIAEPNYQEKTIIGINSQKEEKVITETIEAIKAAKGSKSKAAKQLGISRTTLWRRLKKINPELINFS